MPAARLIGRVCACAAALVASAVADADPGPPPPPAVVAAMFSVREATVQTLAVPGDAAAGGVFSTQLVLGGEVVDVVLEPVSVRAPGFVLLVDDGFGVHAVEAPAERSFTGIVPGRPSAAARLSLVNGSWRGVVDLGEGAGTYWVQPLSDGQPGQPAERHVVFSAASVVADGRGCEGGIDTGAAQASGRAKGTVAVCNRETQIAFDADVLFYQQNGSSVPSTTADIDSIVNAMNLIYARDTGVTFVVTQHIVRTAPGLYTSSSPSTLLSQMASEWQANQGGVVRDIAHLMTGQVFGSTIGLAYNGAVCSTAFGYGLSFSRYTSNFSLRVSLTSHEVGHNFSASHCNGDADCSIMCSTNGGCTGSVTGFSSRSINEIRPYAQGSSCLVNGVGLATNVPPHATPDAATGAPGGYVDIDVLANDYDGNCQTLSIQSFPASTPKGTLTRLVGAGPAGRDLIRYSPGAGSSGTDVWTYTLADTAGQTAPGTVTVTIPPPKAPDWSGGTRPLLDAAYYRLSGRASVPADFSGLFNFRTNTYTNTPINFTSTTGEFASSGRSDNFCAVATASVNLPAAGSWTFFTQSDEGSLLYLDGALVVNNDFAHASQERSGTVNGLAIGSHALRVEYFELTGAAELIVKYQGPGTAKQVIPGTRLSGFQLRFHELPDALSTIPAMAGMTPLSTGTAANINFASGTGNFAGSTRPADVGAVFTGLISVPTTGLYTFFLESDDGSRLTLGASQVVVSNDGVHSMSEVGGQVALLAGLHTFKVEYFNGATPGGLVARWQGPGIAKAVIPAANLFRLPVACNPADVGSLGGVTGPDGLLDNNDFVAFINLFFTPDPRADVGSMGGAAGSDGVYDNNDFVSFINFFFSPCG